MLYAMMWCLVLLVGCAAPLRNQCKQPPAGVPDSDGTANPAAASPVADAADAVSPGPEAGAKADPATAQEAAVSEPEHGKATDDPDVVRIVVSTAAASEPKSAVPASAQEELTAERVNQEMSLDEALQYARTHHPRLRARQREVEVARAKLIAAGLLTNPQLTLDYRAPMGDEGDGSQISGRLMFTIPTADKLRLGKSVASADIYRAQYALGRESHLVLQQAGAAAIDVLYLQELLDLQARLSDLAAKQAALQQGRFEAQQVPFSDAIQADVAAKDIELRRLDTLAQLGTARLRLSRAIAMNPPGVASLKGQLAVDPLPQVPAESLLAAAEKNMPDIGEARAALLRSQRQLALARAQAVPDLQIGPRSQTSLGGDGDVGILGGRVAVDLPMFNRNQGGISESAAQIEVDRARLEDVELTTLGDVAAVYEELRSLQSRIQYCGAKVLPLAERTETTIREDEVTRSVPPIQISNLLLEVVRIRVAYLQFRYRYATLYRQLENLLGCRLVELQESTPGLPAAGQKPFAAEPLTQ